MTTATDTGVEIRITTSSIAGIDPETGEAWTYSNIDSEGRPIERLEHVRADRAHELIAAGAAELTDSAANPTAAELDELAETEREKMRDRIRIAEREREERERQDAEARERAIDKASGRRTRR